MAPNGEEFSLGIRSALWFLEPHCLGAFPDITQQFVGTKDHDHAQGHGYVPNRTCDLPGGAVLTAERVPVQVPGWWNGREKEKRKAAVLGSFRCGSTKSSM